MAGATPLESLSVEVIDSILNNIDGSKASLAATSRTWQRTVEDKTFASISFNSTQASLDQFNRIFADTARIPLVRKLKYRVILPPYSDKRRIKFPRKTELTANDAALTQALINFHNRLEGWNALGGENIQFTLEISCPSDEFTGAWDLDQRNMYTYLTLTESLPEAGLPPIPAISSFATSLKGDRRIHPDALHAILSSLPRLREAEWEFYAPERRLPTQRKQLRQAFGRLLQSTPFPQLDKLTIVCEDPDPTNERFEPRDECDDRGEDAVSLGIRRICSLPNLRTLRLTGTYIFSPAAFSVSDGEIYSPSLSRVMIDVSAVTPDGGWYFTGDPNLPIYESEDDSEDEGDPDIEFDSDISDEADRPPGNAWDRANGNRPTFSFRTTPNPQTFISLITALARAVKCMPGLGTLDLSWNEAGVSFAFFAPGRRPRRDFSPEVKAFHDLHAGKLRCVVTLSSRFEGEREVGEELKGAVAEACEPDCVFVLR